MGTIETALLLKYAIPLAVKLLKHGKDEEETVTAVTEAIDGMAIGDVDVGDALVKANKEQTKNIIDGLFGIITGTANALGGLVKALFGLSWGS